MEERNEKLKEMLKLERNKSRPTFSTETSNVLDKVKAFLPRLKDANDRLLENKTVNEKDEYTIRPACSSCEEDSDDESVPPEPMIKIDVALFKYEGENSNASSEDDDASDSSLSQSDNPNSGDDEALHKNKKFRLKMPGQTKRKPKVPPVQEIQNDDKDCSATEH